jgi:hypothetical protein
MHGARRSRRAPRRTRDDPPRWSSTRSLPRVLVEHGDPDVREALVAQLRDRGYDALACAGPDADGCPILHDEPCPALATTDAVVTGLARTEAGRALAEATLRLHPGRPLLVEGTPYMLRDASFELRAHGVYPLRIQRIVRALGASDAES